MGILSEALKIQTEAKKREALSKVTGDRQKWLLQTAAWGRRAQ